MKRRLFALLAVCAVALSACAGMAISDPAPVIEQEKKTPPELKWEQSKESQWRGQDTLSRWEEGNHPRRPEPPPMEPKAPHIALKLLLIVGVLLLAGAVATGLYFGLIA